MTLPYDQKKREEYLANMKKINLGRKYTQEINDKKRHIGLEHPNWKGGRSDVWYRKLMANSKIPAICIDCGKTEKIHIHHKDGDHHHNVVENLEFVCPKCHKKRHPRKHTEEEIEKLRQHNKGEGNPNYGNKWSEEKKKKLSEKLKGRIPWNKGKSNIYSEEMLNKMSERQIGKHNSQGTEFKKGMVPWWKKKGFSSVWEAIKSKR